MAAFSLRSLSLVRLSALAIFAVSAAAIFVVLALFTVRASSSEAVTAWRRYADQASIEQRAFRGFITQAGLGGLIDDYAQLVETGDPALAGTVYAHGGAALAAIGAYPVDPAATEEARAKEALQADIRAYLSRVAPIVAMHKAGRAKVEISQYAQIADPAASKALETLAQGVARTVSSGAGLDEPKGLALLDLRRAVGLEGALQYADAFLSTGELATRAKAAFALAAAREALVRYRRHPVSIEEDSALEEISRQLDAIAAVLANPTAPGRAIDASQLQAALLRLETKVYADVIVAQNNLQNTLSRVSAQAGWVILLVAGGAVLIVGGSVWLLAFRMGRRIRAITLAMRSLAAGRLDVDIPAVGDSDEIGEMSRALLIFRDGLKANLALTKELADSSRLASLGAMVAGMAHELNTPIGNALAVSSTMEDQCKALARDISSGRILRSTLEGHAASLQEAAGLIQRNLARASEHIGSFKQVAVDRTSGQRREFALDEVLRNIVQTMTPQFKRTPYRLSLGYSSDIRMDSYPGALSQVLTNLIENALKHGLTGRAAGRVAVVADTVSDALIRIIVSDDGVGIPPDIRPRIFKAFFTTKAGRGGSGLGLHIVKSIVCGPLGGEIVVEPGDGGGARFIITLPNTAPASVDAMPGQPQEAYYAAAQAAA